jgi:hypothetical protein
MVNAGRPDETWTSTVTTWPSTPSSVALATDASTVDLPFFLRPSETGREREVRAALGRDGSTDRNDRV